MPRNIIFRHIESIICYLLLYHYVFHQLYVRTNGGHIKIKRKSQACGTLFSNGNFFYILNKGDVALNSHVNCNNDIYNMLLQVVTDAEKVGYGDII